MRATCPTCRRPEVVCYCAHVQKLETKTRVVILQHPRERDVPINTARIAALCLPNAELHVGVRWDDPAVLQDPERPAALLYPGPGAIDVEAHPPKGPITLVVVDGTWWQAKKLVRSNPKIAALPRYAFRPDAPSNYRIRKEPDQDYVSTIEALAHVLGVLEGRSFASMMAPFEAMVDKQIAYAKTVTNRRHPKKNKPFDPRRRLPPPLKNPTGDFVCVHGEANSWAYDSPHRPESAIVQWVACRPSTGETFEAFVAPRLLAPNTSRHLEVEAERIVAGGTRDELEARWRAFVKPHDVIVAWGTYAATLFGEKAHVDLRVAAKLFTGVRIGTMKDFVIRFGISGLPPLGSGRAGRRLAQLVAIMQELVKDPVLPASVVEEREEERDGADRDVGAIQA